jgi:radical SAM superfamily enzyme YgiQ (UPF0313 family)
LGEGEETLIELLNQLEGAALSLSKGQSEAELESILGLAYKSPVRRAEPVEASNLQSPVSSLQFSNSPILINPRRPDITALDSLPFPAWDLIDVQKYKSIWTKRHGYFSMNMVTTRGCPYHCNWCAKPIWGQRYNSRSPENVVAEMKWIKENFAPDHIWFADDILGLKPNWIEKFALLLEEADAVIPFKCLQRADLVNEKTAAALAKAGCKTVWVGAESGSQTILDAMDKGDSVEDIYNAARLLRANGIEVGFFLQFGYPGETWDDVQKTLKMVRECAPDDIGISVSYPLPGTKFFERVKLELGEKQNWIDSQDLAMLYRGPFPTEFYRILHGRVHHEFRARRALRKPSLRGLLMMPLNFAGLMRSELQLRSFVLPSSIFGTQKNADPR